MRKFLQLSLLIAGLTCTNLSATPLPNITADGAYLIETNSNTILYSKNGQLTFYPASTTKVLTALTVVDDLPMQQIITKSQNSVNNVPADSSHIGLRVGDQYNVYDGLHAVLMASDNFVCYDLALADSGSISAFSERMNRLAKDAGATHSNFVNPHGYHDTNHYTTPHDLAYITDAAFNNLAVEKIAGTQRYTVSVLNTGQKITIDHTSALLDSHSPYYNSHVVAAKTGYHTPAGRCLVAKALYGNMDLIGVIMRTESPLQFQDMNKLFQYASENFYYNEETGVLKNVSYSDTMQPVIDKAFENGWLTESPKNYRAPITWYDFLTLLGHVIPYQETLPLNSSYYNQFMTKEQLASFIHHVLSNQLELVTISPQISISDVETLSKESQDAIYFAIQSGLIPLKGSQFLPNSAVPFEEALSTIDQISRLIEQYKHFSVTA